MTFREFTGKNVEEAIRAAMAEFESDLGDLDIDLGDLKIDLDNLPLDDGKTYELFRDGQTAGVFQFESSGMRDTLRKAKPQVLEDLIALAKTLVA